MKERFAADLRVRTVLGTEARRVIIIVAVIHAFILQNDKENLNLTCLNRVQYNTPGTSESVR